jgi:hypothetical protein
MKRIKDSRRACLLKHKKGGGGGGGGVSSTSHSAPYLPFTLALVLLLGLFLLTPPNIGVDSAVTTSATTNPNPNQYHKRLRVDYASQEPVHNPDLFVNRIGSDYKAVLADSPVLLSNDKGSGSIKEQLMSLSGKGTRGGGGGREQEEKKEKEEEKEKEKEDHLDIVVTQALAPSNGSPLRKVTIIILL